VVSDFNINEISIVKFINLYCRVNGLCIAVLSSCRFCGKWMIKYFFFIVSNLSILTVVMDVWEEAYVLSLNGA